MTLWKKCAALGALSALFVGCTTSTTVQNSPSASAATQQTVSIYAVSAQGIGQHLGQVTLQDTKDGLKISPQLTGLPEGLRGFHIHENPSCQAAEKDGVMGAALAAGAHYNPHQVPNHGTPLNGHLGDLPSLVVTANGTANTPVVAPRLTLADVKNRAIMVHAGGDNYADHPAPLGGGGARIACGVIQ